jgi:hypothetical protein
MTPRDERMRENEDLFRTANDRLREQIEDDVAAERSIPFLCECMDDLCMERIDMTLGDYRHVGADGDTFAVAPGHAAPQGEVVVEERNAFHVVQKEAA